MFLRYTACRPSGSGALLSLQNILNHGNFKRAKILWVLLLSAMPGVFAGGFELPQVTDANIWKGLYLELGGAYNFIQNNGSVIAATNLPVALTVTINRPNQNFSSFSPIGSLGFWYPYTPYWLYGMKFSYQWVNFVKNYNDIFLILPPSFQLGLGVNSTQVTQVFMLLVTAAHPFRTYLTYIGAGPIAYTLSHQISTSFRSTNTLIQQSTPAETLWGGAFQVGFDFLIPGGWAIDVAYIASFTTTAHFPTLVLIDGLQTRSFAWRNSFINQEAVLSLTKIINL